MCRELSARESCKMAPCRRKQTPTWHRRAETLQSRMDERSLHPELTAVTYVGTSTRYRRSFQYYLEPMDHAPSPSKAEFNIQPVFAGMWRTSRRQHRTLCKLHHCSGSCGKVPEPQNSPSQLAYVRLLQSCCYHSAGYDGCGTPDIRVLHSLQLPTLSRSAARKRRLRRHGPVGPGRSPRAFERNKGITGPMAATYAYI